MFHVKHKSPSKEGDIFLQKELKSLWLVDIMKYCISDFIL